MTFRQITDTLTATDNAATGSPSIFGPDNVRQGGGYIALLWVDGGGNLNMSDLYGYGAEDCRINVDRYLSAYRVQYAHVVEPVGDEDSYTLTQAVWRNYRRNPWTSLPALVNNLAVWAEHMPQPSTTVDGMLAYFASPAHRKAGRLTPIKPGRYLRKFFGEHMTEEEIQDAALVWSNKFAPRALQIATDADEIELVYTNGPSSCMSGGIHDFSSRVHPSRVYAGPDLAVAYIGEARAAEGRAVVWPDKKVWMRAYGDVERMEAALINAGYRAGSDSDFTGARVQKITEGHAYVMPYLDRVGSFTDEGEFCVLSYRGIDGQSTSGLAGDDRCRCADCGDMFDPDYEGAYVDAMDGHLCDDCISNDWFYCDLTDTYHRDSERADTRGDYVVSLRGVQRSSNWFLCEGDDVWVNLDDDDYVILDDGRTVSMTWADDNAFRCEHSEEWVEDTGSNRIEIDGGEYLDADGFHASYGKTRLEKIAQWCVDNDRTPESEELRDIVGQIMAQAELELEAA